MELISEIHEASLKEITDKFGDYIQVHTKLKEMLLEGKILRFEREENGEHQEFIKLVDPRNTFWDNMNAQPCLTCPIMGECGIENPVSPATCEDFADWLEAEIQLELMQD